MYNRVLEKICSSFDVKSLFLELINIRCTKRATSFRGLFGGKEINLFIEI